MEGFHCPLLYPQGGHTAWWGQWLPPVDQTMGGGDGKREGPSEPAETKGLFSA